MTPIEQVQIKRAPLKLLPDARRVIAKPYLPGEEIFSDGKSRVKIVLERVLALPEAEAISVLGNVLRDFAERHRNYEQVLEENFELVRDHLDDGEELSREQRLLIGAYFTHEFSIEAAALFNPSIVQAPDQSGLMPGQLRFIMSLRAVGEGHISSIEFRTGVVDDAGRVSIEPMTAHAMTGQRQTPVYDKQLFVEKLAELDGDMPVVGRVLDPLPEGFTFEQLRESIRQRERRDSRGAAETIRLIHWLASSNYVLSFPDDTELGERVIFPVGPNESRGMEDARFVRFREEDGSILYFATYTAFDGVEILPQSIMTQDFQSFRISTLTGPCAQNKGMALFPRHIAGRYAMLSRNDRENIFLMTSENVRRWDRAEKLVLPTRPWELIQVGNCGSPIETSEGWLVLTHGVGPMRQYTIGAMLLDLEAPSRVIAHLPDPLMFPNHHERDGYVPNVLYSCGSLVHGDLLVIPYGFSDYGIGMGTVPLNDLVDALLRNRV